MSTTTTLTTTTPTTVAALLLARAEDDHPGLRFEGRQWSWRQVVEESRHRARWIRSLQGTGPVHVGVLLGNVPEYLFWLGAAALSGSVVVGINPTRRGAALAGDVRRTQCAVVVTDGEGMALLDGLDIGVPDDRVLLVDDPGYDAALGRHRSGVPPADGASTRSSESTSDGPPPDASDLYLLLFTSGTTGAPKRSGAPRGGWPPSPSDRPRPTGSTAPMWPTAPCPSSTATP